MTKKRKRSVDDTTCSISNTYHQQYVKKSKMHPGYFSLYSRNTVPVFRKKVRDIGNRKWYSLRKSNLACVVMIHECAMTISRFFRRIVASKRRKLVESKKKDGSRCPITLTPVSEINSVFVHDGIVFSKKELVEYMEVTIDFCNPITRKVVECFEIQRLGSSSLLDKYKNRVFLRDKEIDAIRDFSFWETELDNIMIRLTRMCHRQSSSDFYENHIAFHNTWLEMKRNDRNRTVCVVKSLKQSANRFRGRARYWANIFIDNYIHKT